MCMSNWKHPSWAKAAGLFLLRLAIGVVFVYHGYMKLTNIGLATDFFSSLGFPMAMQLAWFVALVEFVGGILIVLGVAPCIVATVLIIDMLVALFTAHLKMPYLAAELPIVLIGGLFAVCGTGGGRWSLWRASCCKGNCGGCGSCASLPERQGENCGCGGHEEKK